MYKINIRSTIVFVSLNLLNFSRSYARKQEISTQYGFALFVLRYAFSASCYYLTASSSTSAPSLLVVCICSFSMMQCTP